MSFFTTHKRVFSLLTALVLMLSITGCAGNNTTTETNASAQTGTDTESSVQTEATAERQTVTVVDATLEEVEVKTNPKSVAIYETSILDILHTLGWERTGIETMGVCKTESYMPDYLADYRDSDDYPNVGDMFEADYDVLDLLEPDLIIGGGRFGFTNTEGKTVDDVKKRYPNTDYLSFNVDMASPEDTFTACLERNYSVLGEVFPNLKEDLDACYQEFLDAFAEISSQTGDKRTLFVMIGPGYITYYGPVGRYSMVYNEFGFTPADTTTDAGGVHGVEVSAEYIKEVNPDVILVLDRNAALGEASCMDDFTGNAMIQETAAYQNGSIYELDTNAWYMNTGGLTAMRQMIVDMENVVANLNK